MAEWWVNNWERVLTVAGFAFGLLIGIPGLIIGIKSWKRKKLTYLVRSNNLFSGHDSKYPEVEVSFKGYGQPLKSLTVTKLVFWNSGNEAIRKQDVVKDDPLAVRAADGVVILSIEVITRVSPLNKIDCTLNRDRTQATISFDYMEPSQGAILQVFHTGASDASIAIRGTVVGQVPIVRKSGEIIFGSPAGSLIQIISIVGLSMLTVGMIILAFSIPIAEYKEGRGAMHIPIFALMALIGLLFFVRIGVFTKYAPRELQSFHEAD